MKRLTDPESDSVRTVRVPPAGFARITDAEQKRMAGPLAVLIAKNPAALVRDESGSLFINRSAAGAMSFRVI